MPHRRPLRVLAAIAVAVAAGGAGAAAEELVTGQLAIRGAVLRVSPERQDIDPGRATVVHTALGDLAPGQGPPGLTVVAELSGPGLDEPLRLTTTPGDPFRVPGLNREGTYTLSGIRLMEGERTISSAVPDAVEIMVHRLVISSITSRALTPGEMDAYGIVIDADNYTAWHYTVGFQVEGGSYELPFDLLMGPQGVTLLESPETYALPVPGREISELPLPTVNSVGLEPLPNTLPSLSAPDMETLSSTPIPGFIIIPTDIAFLNQFFAVIMVVQNGALEASGIELRDLTGVLELSGDGLRQAETEPPTIPGQPVPVLDPGPDGEPGTGDDLTFIVAQARGEATWLVEGLREGHHRLTARLSGELHGLASGVPVPVEGSIPGVVVVRDPRFALTFFHPNVVRTGERYDFRVAVSNTSTTPVYDLSLELPTKAISGARLVAPGDDPLDGIEEGDNDPDQRVDELLPGATAMVRWTLESRQTGRVVASAFNTSNPLEASFVFEIGVGELGIPLSPESLVLPPVVDLLPQQTVVEPALELLGLAHSLANAPNGVEVDLPPVGEAVVRLRGTELAAAGQRHAFGEPLDRSVVGLGLEWMGASQWSPSFDVLRRRSRRGHELEAATGHHLGLRMDVLGAAGALAELEELAITGRPMLLVYAAGAGFEGDARLAVVGSTSGRTAVGQRSDVVFFSRELAGASILEVDAGPWAGEVGVVAVPLAEDGSWQEAGYQVQLWGTGTGDVELEVVVVLPDGSTRRFAAPEGISARAGSLATLEVGPDLESAVLWIDSDGDGFNLGWQELPVETVGAPAPSLIAARFEHTVNPVQSGPYRNIVLLLSRPVDGEALRDLPADEWLLGSELSLSGDDGNELVSDRPRAGSSFRLQLDPRIVLATFSPPLNRHAVLRLSSGGAPLPMVDGAELHLVSEPILVGEGLESGAVRGVVLGPEGGPLEGAVVELYEKLEVCDPIQGCSWFPSLADRVSSDAAGGFVFDAVRFRDRTIPTAEAGFTVRAVDPITGHETRLTARLQGDARVRPLTLAMVGRGDVVGTLRTEDGAPLESPLVVGRSIATPSEGAQAVPDAAGRFRLAGLPVGPVQVVARDGGRYTSATVRIASPGAEAILDLVLLDLGRPLAAVRGSVVDGNTAEPVPGLEVYVTPAGYQGPTHVATTDGDGAFAMTDVPPGVARFKAWDPALGRYVAEAVAELRGDATTAVELVVQESASGAITGTVSLLTGGVETPLAGAYVVARSQGLFTLTDADGHYELTEIPLGRVDLEVWDPVTGAATERTVDLTADGQVLVLDFVLREDLGLGSVTVNVANGRGEPEVSADVALARFGSGFEGRTGDDGSVRIEDVPPGKHDVLVRLGSRLARGTVELLYPGHAAAVNVVLGPLVDATVTVQAQQTGGGSSDVLAPISYRVPGVTSTGRIGQVPESGWTECELDADGLCAIENIPTHVGSLVAVASSGFYGQVSVSKWIDERTPHDLVINFEAPGTVGGRVVRRVGDGVEPIAGAIVELWTNTDSGGLVVQSQVTTVEDGTFQFELVRRGSFSVRTYHPSYGAAWLNGTVSPGQVIDDLELVPRGRAAVEGEMALCFAKSAAKAGSQVRVTLHPTGVPRPLISDLEIDDIADRALDIELGDDDRASFAFTGLMVGGWSLSATSALNGSAWQGVTVGPDGSTTVLEETVCLHPTGTVAGTVSLPETGEPAVSVAVQLFRGGSPPQLLGTETTDEGGAYLFADVPVGAHYQTRAFDGASNRGGVSAWTRLCDASDHGYGDSCTREAVLDVSLAPLGRLVGVLRDHDELPVASAHVRLRTSVVLNPDGAIQSFEREWTTYTAPDGGFAFDGVPAGTAQLTAFDPLSPLFVEQPFDIDPVASPTTSVELALPGTADVTVRVLDPFGAELADGVPVVVFQQRSSDLFREPSGASPTVEHLEQGTPASFSGVVSDRFKTGACLGDCGSFGVGEILGHGFVTALGAAAERRMPDPPADQVVELALVGRSTVAVTVTQDGGPVDGALVRIVGSGFYGPRDVSITTAADGTITPVAGLGVGRYTVSASRAGLGASLELEITQQDHGRSLELELPIELAASSDGVVLAPEGTPAVGALVTMSFDGRSFQAVSGADGSFVFQVLAANHTYRLEATAADGLGRFSMRDIVVGTEAVHLGELRLDEVNPWVAAVAPANGAQDAGPAADVVVDFSERMRYATLVGDAVRLREQGSGAVVATSRTIEELPDPDGDGPRGPFTRVVLSHSALASERLYLVEVRNTVEDLAGRRPAFDFHSTFRTRDVVPPQVLGVSPADDPDGVTPVGPDVVPIVTCSEPMAEASLTAGTVRLLDGGGQPVDAVLDLQRDGFDIRIRPTTALELDSFYTLVIDGVTDDAGLPLAEPFQSAFRVRDLEPPVVTLLPPEGVTVDGDSWTALEGRPLTLRAQVVSNDAVDSVVFSFNGVPRPAVLDPSGEYRVGVNVPTSVAMVTLVVQAKDVSGNLSFALSHEITIVDDLPPTGGLTVDPGVEILPNHLLLITVDAADDHGLDRANVTVEGSVEQTWSIPLDGIRTVESRELRIPVDSVAGDQLTVSCTVEDGLGQRTVLAPRTLGIAADTREPVITVWAPLSGATARSGEEVSFRFKLEDEVIVSTATLEVNGGEVELGFGDAQLPGTVWSQQVSAFWTAPEVAESTPVGWNLTATDLAGNTVTRSDSLTIEPAQGPEDPVVQLICPQAGDRVLPGLDLTISFAIRDDDEVQHYSAYVDGAVQREDEPVNATQYSGRFVWTPPTDAEPGDAFVIRVVARDWNGNEGSAVASVSIPLEPVLAGDQELSSSLEGEDVLLGGGEFTATTVLRPRTLTLIHGAALTTPALQPLVIEGVDRLSIECSAAIDVTGRGYPGGETYPGAGLATDWGAAGSHLGQGGGSYLLDTTFGSITHPREAGAGARSVSSQPGGGVVRIEAETLDLLGGGAIVANGGSLVDSYSSGGAGGALWITANSIIGAGRIEAQGGIAGRRDFASGGGGAIAIEYESIDEATLENLDASGGYYWRPGGAGTIFLDGPGSEFGDLIIDGAGWNASYTVPPSLGSGVAAGGSGGTTLVTDRDDAIPPFFIGHWVRVSSADGSQIKGTWRILAVDGVTATLEDRADLSVGDWWRGVYRFDKVTVRGKGRARFYELDEFGEVEVEDGSYLELVNHEPPTIDPAAIELLAQGGAYVISGGSGAITDPDRVYIAAVENRTTGARAGLNMKLDGGFFGKTIAGSAGDEIWVEATDNHYDSLSSEAFVGSLPANAGPPVVEPDLVSIVIAFDEGGGERYHVQGLPGAVTDPDQRLTVTIRNVTAGSSWSLAISSVGDFLIPIEAAPGDELQLEVTDGHPEPLTTLVSLGPLPDLLPPTIDPGAIMAWARDGRFWLSSEVPAIWDDGEIVEAYARDPAAPGVNHPLEILTDGVLAPSPVNDRTGAELEVVVRDAAGNERSAMLPPLPENGDLPEIDTAFIERDADGTAYRVTSSGSCESTSDPCGFPIRSLDGVAWARLENRTTPLFESVDLQVDEGSCSTMCGIGVFGFDPAVVVGAVGDEIWLVVADGHPDQAVRDDAVWTLPRGDGAPAAALGLQNLVYAGDAYALRLFQSSVSDPDEPISVTATAWRETAAGWVQIVAESRVISSGDALDIPLPGAQEDDLVLAEAVDSTGRSTIVRVGHLPEIPLVEAKFVSDSVEVAESGGGVRLRVELAAPPSATVDVGYRTLEGTATDDLDFVAVAEGALAFGPGMWTRDLVIRVTDDDEVEATESFVVELISSPNVILLEPSSTVVTIVDTQAEPIPVTYSVGVDAGNMLDSPVGVTIEHGQAFFAEPLQEGVGTGDKIVLESFGSIFIVDCESPTTCRVNDGLGRPAPDLGPATALEVVPSFASLAEAVIGAGDEDHLGTMDLYSIGRSLELLCYGGSEDTTPVAIDDWLTSESHNIRVAAAPNQGHRHEGTWSDFAYRLRVSGSACVSTTVGFLELDGLQMSCTGTPGADAAGVLVDNPPGPIEIIGSLIEVDGIGAEGARREGVSVRADGPVNLVVRNSIISDPSGQPGSPVVGIAAGDPDVTAFIANNTFAGLGTALEGNPQVIAVNNLVLLSDVGFSGAFADDSAANLSPDGSAPGPSSNLAGPVVVENLSLDQGSDLHVVCDPLAADDVEVTHNFGFNQTSYIFDRNPDTLAITQGINPGTVQLEFQQLRSASATWIRLSNADSHDWMVEVAMSAEDLVPGSPTYVELVPRSPANFRERAWAGASFATPPDFKVIKLTVWRTTGTGGGHDYVHLVDWWIEGLNPACEQGVDLGSHWRHAFDSDVDGHGRVGLWDIGADQWEDLSVGFPGGPADWWEEEGVARVQVTLSEPAGETISVRYRTVDGSAKAGDDYGPASGRLVFEPGEFSKIISIPLEVDAPGDAGEDFFVELFDAAGAAIRNGWWRFVILEGGIPPRVRLLQTQLDLTEGSGSFSIGIELSDPLAQTVDAFWEVRDQTAFYSADFSGPYSSSYPWRQVRFWPGQTSGTIQFRILDDEIPEGDEGFRLLPIWDVVNALPGVPQYGYIRILDDDGVAP